MGVVTPHRTLSDYPITFDPPLLPLPYASVSWDGYVPPTTDLDALKVILTRWEVPYIEAAALYEHQPHRAVLTAARANPRWEQFHGVQGDTAIHLFTPDEQYVTAVGEDL